VTKSLRRKLSLIMFTYGGRASAVLVQPFGISQETHQSLWYRCFRRYLRCHIVVCSLLAAWHKIRSSPEPRMRPGRNSSVSQLDEPGLGRISGTSVINAAALYSYYHYRYYYYYLTKIGWWQYDVGCVEAAAMSDRRKALSPRSARSPSSQLDASWTGDNRTTWPRVDQLNQFLVCGLCDGYLIDATTVAHCLHSCKSLSTASKE